jgi:hypothetical protein
MHFENEHSLISHKIKEKKKKKNPINFYSSPYINKSAKETFKISQKNLKCKFVVIKTLSTKPIYMSIHKIHVVHFQNFEGERFLKVNTIFGSY